MERAGAGGLGSPIVRPSTPTVLDLWATRFGAFVLAGGAALFVTVKLGWRVLR
jgi:hypothetical protein